LPQKHRRSRVVLSCFGGQKGGNMKSKKLNQKLTLNKKTIANISADIMGKVYGGVQSRITECIDTKLPYVCCIEPFSKGICE